MMDAGLFRRKVSEFLIKTGLPKTKLGRLAVSDPNFVDRLGRTEPRPETIKKVLAFMESYDAN